VIDQNNNPIFDLKKEDFQVLEDKVPQSIEDVSRSEVPVSLGFGYRTPRAVCALSFRL
jgi:hypothetical protein